MLLPSPGLKRPCVFPRSLRPCFHPEDQPGPQMLRDAGPQGRELNRPCRGLLDPPAAHQPQLWESLAKVGRATTRIRVHHCVSELRRAQRCPVDLQPHGQKHKLTSADTEVS